MIVNVLTSFISDIRSARGGETSVSVADQVDILYIWTRGFNCYIHDASEARIVYIAIARVFKYTGYQRDSTINTRVSPPSVLIYQNNAGLTFTNLVYRHPTASVIVVGGKNELWLSSILNCPGISKSCWQKLIQTLQVLPSIGSIDQSRDQSRDQAACFKRLNRQIISFHC